MGTAKAGESCLFLYYIIPFMKKISFVVLATSLVLTGCKEEYMPSISSEETSLLVVEANLNPRGPVVVRLSRTTAVDSSNAITPENNASVSIEGKDNSIQIVSGAGNGNYTLLNPVMTIGDGYRLRIRTAGGDEFLSAYVTARRTPEIDSISWQRTDKGVSIFANTDGSMNPISYFRWDYVETWEIHTYFHSAYIHVNGAIRPRIFPQEDVSVCWKTEPARQIVLGSSLRFQSGILRDVPLTLIPDGNERLSVRYSIIVSQCELDADAYKFYEILKRNSQDLGTHFGPMPSELKGNIHCVNKPEQPVIGFVIASEITEKRVFIDRSQIGGWNESVNCPEIPVDARKPLDIAEAIASGRLPYTFTYMQDIPYWIFSLPYCLDCTSRGGVTVKPSFW
jgi:hypothetical protein